MIYEVSTIKYCSDHLTQTLTGSNLRCSRPLCSSQNTVGTHPHPTTQMRQKMGPEVRFDHPAGPVPQDPTACMCHTSQPETFLAP